MSVLEGPILWAAGERDKDLMHEGGNIVRLATGGYLSILNHFLIDPTAACILNIGP